MDKQDRKEEYKQAAVPMCIGTVVLLGLGISGCCAPFSVAFILWLIFIVFSLFITWAGTH